MTPRSSFVEAHEQRAEIFPGAFGFSVPADHELLLQVELDLDPRSRASAHLVSGTAAFTDQPLKSECPGFSRSSSMSFVKLIENRSAAGGSVKSSANFAFRS